MAFADAPENRAIWVKVGSKVQCDPSAGEKYIKDSSGTLPNIGQCKRSCEDSDKCRSISYIQYLKTGWCSHFSTPCTNHKTNTKAASLRLGTSGCFWFVALMICFMCK